MAGIASGAATDQGELTPPIDDPLSPLTDAVKRGGDAAERTDDHLRLVGAEIIRVDAGTTNPLNVGRYEQVRIRYLILNRATAGAGVLIIGTVQYPFTLPAEPVVIPFPIVIGRGVDIAFTGDGTCYLIGDPE